MKSSRSYGWEIRALVWIIIASWLLSFTMAFYWWAENRDAEIASTRIRVLRLMTVKEFVYQTQTKFQLQIHEWKNLLVRYDNPIRFAKHLKAFHELGEETQGLLMGLSKIALREKLDDAPMLQSLVAEHEALDARYMSALKHLDGHNPSSVHVVDNLVYGADHHLARSLEDIADHIGGHADREITSMGNLELSGYSWWGSYGAGLIFLQVITLLSFLRLIKVNQLVDKKDKRAATIFKSIGDALVVVDKKACIEYLNAPAERLLGVDNLDIQGQPFDEAFPILNENTGQPARNPVAQVMRDKVVVELENHTLLRNRAGKLIPIEDSAAPIFTDRSALDGVVLVFHDMTQRHDLLSQIRMEHFRFQAVFEQTGIGIAFCTPHTTQIVEANHRMAQMLGADDPLKLVGRRIFEFYANVNATDLNHFFRTDADSDSHQILSSDVLLEAMDGTHCWYYQVCARLGDHENHIPDQLVFTFWNVNDRVALENRLELQSISDELTGLGNRHKFRDAVNLAIQIANPVIDKLALLLIDLDNFKEINDTKGHFAGDELLKKVSKRLKAAVDDQSTVARLGGDEFVILLKGLDTVEIEKSVNAICNALTEPFVVEEDTIVVTASCGVSIFPDHGRDHHALLRRADLAMYSGKTAGKNCHVIFTDQIERKHAEEQILEKEIKQALVRQEFELYFQPKVNLFDLTTQSAEVLIRWNHPQRGLLFPVDFIPHAERSRLIIDIGEWVINETCRYLQQWDEAGLPEFLLSFNASPRQLLDGGIFIRQVENAMRRFEVDPRRLTMEITETALMNDVSMITTAKVNELGISLSLDDFGTGYSSLSLLQKLPLASLKIDKSFVFGFLANQTDDTLVKSIIGLGRDLGLNVVAEGIETADQAKILAGYGCHYGQGYYFSKPVPEKTFIMNIEQAREGG